MDTLSEDFLRTDVDTQMTVLTHEDFSEQDLDTNDEVEDLRNSLREAVHDETVRPKMQCLMMDPSFSMVTVQDEDSGIEWETNPSRCTTPWASEAGNLLLQLSSPITVRPATPGSLPAGKIIFVMDEEQISKRKKTKERVSDHKSKADKQREILLEDADAISGRPELVGVSLPNVKTEEKGDKEEVADPVADKEQWLFSLVSEGSEILNIVVPHKLSTVDEEESKNMVDNLSYLEETPVAKSSKETNDTLFDLNNELEISKQVLMSSDADGGEHMMASHPIGLNVMDPPGAPVARPPGRGATGNVDYFEKFTLIDAQAPGSPAVDAEEVREIQGTKEPVQSEENNTAMTVTVDNSTTEDISGEDLVGELLDEVFYGGTDDNLIQSALDREEGCDVAEAVPFKFTSKESCSALFGSQEDILTQIFLPEGPPKIIDPILLEEPKAMAFLYTDLYEEAMGSRKKEEDTESMTSEKSFHSRHSDREAMGYLEKYVLIDETPVLETEPTEEDTCEEEGIRMLSEDLYTFSNSDSNPVEGEMPNAEEEITDFFRSSANSSPCDVERFPTPLEERDIQISPKTSLDPVDIIEEKEEDGRKEQREEEKETATPAETADEGDCDGEEMRHASSAVTQSNEALSTEANETLETETETVKGTDSNDKTIDKDTTPTPIEGNNIEAVQNESGETETARKQRQEELDADVKEIQGTKEPVQFKDYSTTKTLTVDSSTISGEDLLGELLDDVFYGGTDDNLIQSALDIEEPSNFPLKESGSALFGSQEDILTPIFLPEGPAKMIDPILLEEPKAMAFLYTDLYEEAMGSRKKEEDTESMTSEKSFHSRHSDREATGYLEKYVLKDETPVLETEPTKDDKCEEEGIWMLSEDSCTLANAEEEITDFFRSSANSSPCDVEPFPTPLEERVIQSETSVSKTAENVVQLAEIPEKGNVETPIDPLNASSDELFPEEPDWGSAVDHLSALDMKHDSNETDQTCGSQALEMRNPFAPPRVKAASIPKISLDLTPLTPVDIMEEKEEDGRKEQRKEAEETTSPAETADEGDCDGEETRQASSAVTQIRDALSTEPNETAEAETEPVKGKDGNDKTINRDTTPALIEGNDIEAAQKERGETERATQRIGPEEIDSKSPGSARTEVKPGKQTDSLTESTTQEESNPPPALVNESAKESGLCIIL